MASTPLISSRPSESVLPPVLQTRRQPVAYKHTRDSFSSDRARSSSLSSVVSPTALYDRSCVRHARGLTLLSLLSLLFVVLLLEGVGLER